MSTHPSSRRNVRKPWELLDDHPDKSLNQAWRGAWQAATSVLGWSDPEAHDVVHDVIVSFESVRHSQDIEAPGAWAHTAAWRRAIRIKENAWRERTMSMVRVTLDEQAPEQAEVDSKVRLASSNSSRQKDDSGIWSYVVSQNTEPDPSLYAEHHEIVSGIPQLMGRIREAISALDPDDRELIRLVRIHGNHRKVAEESGKSWANVRVRWSRLMLRLYPDVLKRIAYDPTLCELFGDALRDPVSRHELLGSALRMNSDLITKFVADDAPHVAEVTAKFCAG